MRRFSLKIVIFLVVFALVVVSNAQNVRQTLLKSGTDFALVRIDFLNYSTQDVDVNGEIMQTLVMENAYPILEKGSPELLQSTFSLIVPNDARPEIEIIDTHYSEISNFKLAPSKGTIYRNVNPDDVPYVIGDVYKYAKYLLDKPAKIDHDYQLRDFHGIAVKAYPFDYNPANKTLKAYSTITIKITFGGTNSTVIANKNNKAFDEIYSNHFLNYSNYRSTPVSEEGSILIIAPEIFLGAMQPYVDWKTRIGYSVEMIPISTAGSNSSQIKSYITDYYNDHNLAFVLIVGDNNLFPVPIISQYYSDNNYTEIVGNDNYPDIILGKISAENLEQLNTQIERFLEYEQNPSNYDHFPVFLGIASEEGGPSSGDNGEIDWQHIRLINNKLLNFTYTSGYELFEGSQGGLDAAGDPNINQVATAVNSGVGIINYCGHGNWDRWNTTNFNNNSVNALTNVGKLPFVFSVACLNGEYYNKTCYAETWLRATHNGQPSGAVGFTGSTINQPWKQPMRAQDCIIDILTDVNNTQKKITFGGAFFNGMIGMLDEYPSEKCTETFRTWILFGDPTLLLRNDIPQELSIDHLTAIPIGTQSVSFTSAVEDAKISVVHNNAVLNTENIVNGFTDIELNGNFTPIDTLFVTGTARNYIPYQGIIQFIPNEGPYVVCNGFVINNENGIAEYDNNVNITASFKNVGVETANNVIATISTNDEYVTITNGSITLNTIGPDETKIQNNAFSFNISPSIPNKHIAKFKLTIITPNIDTIQSVRNITIFAPQPEFSNFLIDDSSLGNNNSRLDYEETAMLKISIKNIGDSKSKNGTLTISNPADELILSNNSFNVPQLDKSESITFDCQITASNELEETTITYIKATYTTGEYSITKYFPIKIGAIIENWETNDFTNFDWQNNSSTPWFITPQTPYKGSYCVKSGKIGNSQSTNLQLTINNTVSDSISFYYKVSSEEGDYLRFEIDNQKVGEWTGFIPWTRAVFPVEPGTHTYRWKYVKDFWWTSGSDCAWIDEIEFPAGKVTSPVGLTSYSDVEVRVMPNPTTDYIYVELGEVSNITTYRLFDFTGKLLCGGKLNDRRTKISLTNYPKGTYILEILDKTNIIKTQKIIKQ